MGPAETAERLRARKRFFEGLKHPGTWAAFSRPAQQHIDDYAFVDVPRWTLRPSDDFVSLTGRRAPDLPTRRGGPALCEIAGALTSTIEEALALLAKVERLAGVARGRAVPEPGEWYPQADLLRYFGTWEGRRVLQRLHGEALKEDERRYPHETIDDEYEAALDELSRFLVKGW